MSELLSRAQKKRLRKAENRKKQATVIPEEKKHNPVTSNEIIERIFKEQRKWKPLQVLEKGSYSEVYVASIPGKINSKFPDCKEIIIAKKLTGCSLDTPEQRAEYVRIELAISQALLNHNCPNLVKIYSVDQEKKKVYLIYAGLPLISIIDLVPVDKMFVTIFIDHMIEAAFFLYKRNYIHRDISFRNITLLMNLTDNGVEAKFTLIDVGLCSQHIDGTALAPRKTRAPDEQATWRTDIYYIGLCAKLIMSKIANPYHTEQANMTKIQSVFGSLVTLSDNMMSENPILRPNHMSIKKAMALERMNKSNLFGFVSMNLPEEAIEPEMINPEDV